MPADYIDSYLIKLGFTRDILSEVEVKKSLDSVKKAVEDHVGSVGKSMLEWQGAITGAFLGVGAASIGLIDKLATADLATKTLAARMMLSLPDTRAFTESLKLLGATTEDLMANPQLAKYANQLFEDTKRMQDLVGAQNIEGAFGRIEELQQQFTRLHGIIDFLSMEVPLKLWAKLMPGDDLLKTLSAFDEKLISGIDKYSDKIADYLVPIMRDVKQVFTETVTEGKDLALLFTNLVGIFDPDLEGATFSYEKFGKAIEDLVGGLTKFVDLMIRAEGLISHSGNAVILALTGHTDDAAKQFGEAKKDMSPSTILIDLALGLFAAASAVKAFGAAAAVATWPLKTLGLMGRGAGAVAGEGAVVGESVIAGEALGASAIGGVIAIALPIIVTAIAAYELYKHKDAVEQEGQTFLDRLGIPAHGVIGEHLAPWKSLTDQTPGIVTPAKQGDHLKSIAQQVADETGADPRLIFEDLMHETGGGKNRGARELHNYSGIRKPGSTEYRDFESDDQYVKYYSGLLKHNYPGAVTAKNEQEFAHAFKSGRGGRQYMEDSEENYAHGMQGFAHLYGADQRSGAPGGGDVQQNIGSISVKIEGGSNLTPEQVTTAVSNGVKQQLREQTATSTGQLIMQAQGIHS
jgi:hypothetical protein